MSSSKFSRALSIIISLWVASIVCSLPQVLMTGLVYNVCYDDGYVLKPELYSICAYTELLDYSFEISAFVFFLVPISVITILYVLIGLKLRTQNSNLLNGRYGHRHKTRWSILSKSK